MYQQITIYKAGLASSIIVNELVPPLHYPVRTFTWTQPTRGDDLPKMETAGKHDRYSDVDAMAITMEGSIIADTTTDYWAARKALLNNVIPTNDRLYRYHSLLRIKLDGDSETYWCNVILKDYDAPTEANFPTVTPFQFQWENTYGYWRALSNNAVAFI